MAENFIYITPAPITFEQIENMLATDKHLALSAKSVTNIEKCRNYLDHKIDSQQEPIYGITTGFGSLCNRTISKDDLSQLQVNLVISHACGIGQPVEPGIVRLMLLLKAYALSLGNSGVQTDTVQRLLDLAAANELRHQVELARGAADGVANRKCFLVADAAGGGLLAHQRLPFLSDEWPGKKRVGANSPSFIPTMSSLTDTGTNLRPL